MHLYVFKVDKATPELTFCFTWWQYHLCTGLHSRWGYSKSFYDYKLEMHFIAR